ncbi:amidohydrolase family protein [Paenibacillus cymbidii]|uniref:amidohydrolase family protein n=1 Tax=Paenibacillus cymbidii TaxID=1639034 RepID=UPI0010813B25|nr:amidohydrolase family protein [Paenibacillus cymbidii]
MKLIDCSCAIGYKTINYEVVNHENFIVREKVKQARDAEELLQELDFCGIDAAVVSHNTMADVDPDYGNRQVTAEAAKAPERLIPTWTVLPPVTESRYAPEQLFPRMKAGGVRLLRAYPERNRYMLNAVAMGDLLGEIAAARIPLYVSPSEGWQTVYGVLQEFPTLTVILYNYGLWSHARYTFPLFRAYPNFHMETGDMQTAGEIKEICAKFGSERLLFGSDFPSNNIGGPLATLLGSGIAEEHTLNIAHRNIERLLSEVTI